ncbi:MAG: hypothetical protein E5X96_05780, partial [Mesorhizobium sp.]
MDRSATSKTGLCNLLAATYPGGLKSVASRPPPSEAMPRTIRTLTASEVETLVEWAAREGWN